MSETQQTGRPGRYVRSTGGLIGSMIVLVLVVIGVVIFRAAFRTTPRYDPEPIDYRSLVVSVQQQGLRPAYPAELPRGWFVKEASFAPGDRPVLDLAMTTADDHFVGSHQEDRDADELVHDLVGSGATRGDDVTIASDVGSRWQEWTDTDGDHGFSTELGDETLLVYGSAPIAEIRELIGTLTTDQLRP